MKTKKTVPITTPSKVDQEKRIVEIRGFRALIEDGTLAIKGDTSVGRGFLVKVKSDAGEYIRDVLFIINRENTAICRNWPVSDSKGGSVKMPQHRQAVMVEMAANTGESSTFLVTR